MLDVFPCLAELDLGDCRIANIEQFPDLKLIHFSCEDQALYFPRLFFCQDRHAIPFAARGSPTANLVCMVFDRRFPGQISGRIVRLIPVIMCRLVSLCRRRWHWPWAMEGAAHEDGNPASSFCPARRRKGNIPITVGVEPRLEDAARRLLAASVCSGCAAPYAPEIADFVIGDLLDYAPFLDKIGISHIVRSIGRLVRGGGSSHRAVRLAQITAVITA